MARAQKDALAVSINCGPGSPNDLSPTLGATRRANDAARAAKVFMELGDKTVPNKSRSGMAVRWKALHHTVLPGFFTRNRRA